MSPQIDDIRSLHLNVVSRMLFILGDNIHANAFARLIDIHRFFYFHKGPRLNLNL